MMEVLMRKINISAFVSVMLLTFLISSTPARAASVEQVVAACDKMDAEKPGSCSLAATDNGLGGCTKNGCFFCPADGSRQCHATRAGGKPGKPGKPGEADVVVTVGKIQLKCNRQDEGWCK
jgi:hypothetical protein